MSYSLVPLTKLMEQFEKLPGVGKKSAQRLAFHILNMSDDKIDEFIETINSARHSINKCKICQNLTENEVCDICSDASRDKQTICVVEKPKDVMAFERTKEYNGTYHVLHGLISPVDKIGPEDLFVGELLKRISKDDVKEVIMATSPNVEGEATAIYVAKLLKPLGVKVTRLAYGMPVGTDFEFADEVTLVRSLEGRNEI